MLQHPTHGRDCKHALCVRWAQSRPLRAWTIKDFPCVVYQGLVAGRAGSLAHGFEGLTCSHPKCSRPLGI